MSEATQPRKRISKKRIIELVGFIIAITVLGTVIVTALSTKGSSSPSNQVRSVITGNEFKIYNASNFKFSILFPGTPDVKQSKVKTGDKDVPVTTYTKRLDNDTKDYTVRTYDYSGFKLDAEKTLQAALDSAIQNTKGATITDTKKSMYDGHKSIEANYTIEVKNKQYPAHIRFILNGNDMYSVILIGEDQAAFDRFANSLKFT